MTEPDVPDPMPQPPPQPDLEACCGNGCDPCIFDLHDLAMDEYRRELRAWRQRHQATAPDIDQASRNTATD
ncbi:MAG TPA: oxidoreductase-like domain-containing protein [Roseateles sp.]|uniref:oxidoreductase-like domain-containing protein n=1 Tax=Roseateles sp. TaxID=1971397 RepID=UPI002ED91DB6